MHAQAVTISDRERSMQLRRTDTKKQKGAHKAHPSKYFTEKSVFLLRLELWSSSNKSLTSFVSCILSEVLDEASCKILSFLFPLRSVSVSVAWVEDLRINSWEFSWNFEVEVRDSLSWSSLD